MWQNGTVFARDVFTRFEYPSSVVGKAVCGLSRRLATFFLQLLGGVLVDEFVDGQVAASNAYVELVFFDSYCHSFSTKLVDSLWLSPEWNLQLVAVTVVVDEIGHSLVNYVRTDWHIHGETNFFLINLVLELLDLQDILFMSLNQFVVFCLHNFEMFQKLDGSLLRLVESCLMLDDVLRGTFELPLNSNFTLFHRGFMLDGLP